MTPGRIHNTEIVVVFYHQPQTALASRGLQVSECFSPPMCAGGFAFSCPDQSAIHVVYFDYGIDPREAHYRREREAIDAQQKQ